MYDRAPRVTFNATSGTSSAVGPGSYDVSLCDSDTAGRNKKRYSPKKALLRLKLKAFGYFRNRSA